MILVLFDIDGTLLLTGRLGQKSAKIALERVFGTSGRLDDFYPGGRTIEGIFVDTLADAGFKPELYLEKRDQLYEVFFNEFGKLLFQMFQKPESLIIPHCHSTTEKNIITI